MNAESKVKVSHALSPAVLQRIEAEAEREARSRSNMIDVLITEALAARENGDHFKSPGRPVTQSPVDPSTCRPTQSTTVPEIRQGGKSE